MPKNPRLTIGMCTGGTVRAETVRSLLSNMIQLAQNNLAANLLFQIGGYVDVNRNQIVEEALKVGTTHLMFIDNDMIFPDYGVAKLLQNNKDIVGGNYNSRLSPTSKEISGPVTKMSVDGVPVTMLKQDFPTELFKCYAVGTGFMMINTKVFEKMDKPYFNAVIDKQNKHTTEDIEFCRKAGELGFEVWCDPTLEIGHIGDIVY